MAESEEVHEPGKMFFDVLANSAPARGFFLAAVVLVGMWLGVWFLPVFFSRADAGVLGDSFGVITSLFSGLTLLGAGYAVYLQHEELTIARKENRDSEEERKVTREMLARQTEALLTAAKLQAINAIGQLDGARLQFQGLDLGAVSYKKLAPILQRIEASRQFAELLLLNSETPDFNWDQTPIERRTPIRKFYLARVRRSGEGFDKMPIADGRVHELIPPVMELKDELEILSRQVCDDSMLQVLGSADSHLQALIHFLRGELAEDNPEVWARSKAEASHVLFHLEQLGIYQ
ncbi:hypothetical protein TA3x_001722 [Tundrisphaera sp. TA3]|uniref:hypothetical protein n=1 Tax=Tundrisphaera sp. TA3 TaxID=3435775 RepID=UPI003EB87422